MLRSPPAAGQCALSLRQETRSWLPWSELEGGTITGRACVAPVGTQLRSHGGGLMHVGRRTDCMGM